jgi:hypothetical protein
VNNQHRCTANIHVGWNSLQSPTIKQTLAKYYLYFARPPFPLLHLHFIHFINQIHLSFLPLEYTMSTEQIPTADLSDVEIIKRRDLVTFAVVALVQLTTIPLLEWPGRPTICKASSDEAQPKLRQDFWDEWKWWKQEGVDNQWKIAYNKFDDVSWSTIDKMRPEDKLTTSA